MALWSGIDLHSNNSHLAVIDDERRPVYKRKLPNDLPTITRALEPLRAELGSVVVESTYNWYWLVDGLMEAGYRVQLANPSAIRPYSGLKHSDDADDATWLAELAQLGILRAGYIYPKADRPVRDLLRKRGQLVQQRTSNLLSIQTQIQRSTAKRLTADAIKTMDMDMLSTLIYNEDIALAIRSNLRVLQCLSEQIEALERTVVRRVKLREEFRLLQTIPGVGRILALTTMLEVGEIRRFPTVGDFASYCRCVDSARLSNGKKKGEGNVKNGNPYLCWAWVEAANFALRCCAPIERFYQRKLASGHRVLAIKATAHKLCRAGYYVLRDHVPFDLAKAFS
jgi:transposase